MAKHQVLVIYKSGTQVRITCSSFSVKRNQYGDILSVTWEAASPEPLHLGVSEIAAVYKIR